MNYYIRIKQLTVQMTICLALVYQFVVPISMARAFEAPTPPTPPTAPSAPTAPTPPPAPGEEPSPTPTPKPSATPATSPTPTPTPSASPTSNPSPTPTPAPATSPTPTPAPTSSSTGNGTGDSTIETGDASTSVSAVTDANSNTATTPVGSGEGIDLTNSGNGTDSNNSNDINLSDSQNIVQDNDANIANNVEADTTTGNNSNSANTGGTSTTNTGDANTSATIITMANTNAAGIQANEFNVVDDYNGDIILDVNNPCASGCVEGEVILMGNNKNGSDSNNTNTLDSNSESNTFQNNDANLENNIVLSADSGNNVSDNNTNGDTQITTGDANVVANVVSFLNNNVAGEVVINTVNVFGDLVGNIIAPESTSSSCGSGCVADTGSTQATNSGNGSYSDNTNSFSNSSDDLVIQDNKANINNAVAVDSTTGGNQTADNTGGDINVKTGETNIDVNVLNVANQNVSGGDWWIVLVNNAGQWVGKIMGAPDDATMAGSAGTEFVVNPDGTINVTNSGNGSGSTNSNSIANNQSTTTVQTNNANLNNNIQLNANTGGNSASGNTGGNVDIKTGDTNIMANLVNFVNNNIANGGKVTITVINVFGSWIGDFVSPGQSPTPVATNTSDTPAIGGPDNNQNESVSETKTETKTAESETEETKTQNFVLASTSQVTTTDEGSSFFSRQRSRVLGTSQQTVNQSANGQESSESETTQTAEYQQVDEASGPRKIKITWPALITSLMGIIYAGFKAKGMLIG